jgi:hypothetical protein
VPAAAAESAVPEAALASAAALGGTVFPDSDSLTVASMVVGPSVPFSGLFVCFVSHDSSVHKASVVAKTDILNIFFMCFSSLIKISPDANNPSTEKQEPG